MLTKEQKERYFASIFLKEIGEEGIKKLLNSKVVVIGCGGLGSHILPILASSGVGYLSIVDPDVIKLDNLPRQTLYSYKDIGKHKVSVAKKKLEALNIDVKVEVHKIYLNKRNAKKLLSGFDIAIDATDNFESKFMINDVCKKLKIPFVTAGVSDFKGQVLTVIPGESKDFKSLFSELPTNIEQKYIDEDRGVFPSAVAIIGNIASSEVIKYLLGLKNKLLLDNLLVVDTLDNSYKKIKI